MTVVGTVITFEKEGHSSHCGKGHCGAWEGAGNVLHLDLGGPYRGFIIPRFVIFTTCKLYLSILDWAASIQTKKSLLQKFPTSTPSVIYIWVISDPLLTSRMNVRNDFFVVGKIKDLLITMMSTKNLKIQKFGGGGHLSGSVS